MKPNPPPKPGKAKHTVDLVLYDLAARKALGIKKYGVPHQHDNGRDHLLDAYEEALDLAVYLRAEIERRKAVYLHAQIRALAKPQPAEKPKCATCGGTKWIRRITPIDNEPRTHVEHLQSGAKDESVECPDCVGGVRR